MDKEKLTTLMVLFFVVAIMLLAGFATSVERRHNRCVIQLNECNEAYEAVKPIDTTTGGEMYNEIFIKN